jgi:quinohemoprotein ethanol dehydrogenase
MRRKANATIAVSILILCALHAFGAQPALRQGAARDWPRSGGDSDETGFSGLTNINTANVRRLGLAWRLDLPGEQSLEATPLAVGGVLYFTGSRSWVYAVDATSGRMLWHYDPKIWEHTPDKMRRIFGVNRGAAYADGKIVSGTLDGRLIALDARTGRLVWSALTVPAESVHTITGAPRIFGNRVIIGNAGSDWGARGYVTAYDLASGRQIWRFYTVPGTPQENAGEPELQRAAETWRGSYWITGTGGTAWDGMTFDAELNRIYVGTGNAAPYNRQVRSPGGGDNLFVASIIALDADTGEYVWHYQETPGDEWDYDATQPMVLAQLTVAGRPRRVLMQASKNGFFYVLDRATGKLISADKFTKVTWADRVDLDTGRPAETAASRYDIHGEATIWPSPSGAHSWQAMSFSPATGLAYIPVMTLGEHIRKLDTGGVSMLPFKQDSADGTGSLLAWDPVAQRARWSVTHSTAWNGGTLATAGGLVFQGSGDGYLSAYDAQSGKPLWSFNAGLGITATPSTYLAGGTQYVSVLVGYGGATALWSEYSNAGWKFGAQPRRLLTFRIGGTARLPPGAPADFSVHALDDPALQIDQPAAARGATLFQANCAVCHGLQLRSAGAPAPDLRESAVALQPAALRTVIKGALEEQGMPPFAALSDDQIGDLYLYIRAGARASLAH